MRYSLASLFLLSFFAFSCAFARRTSRFKKTSTTSARIARRRPTSTCPKKNQPPAVLRPAVLIIHGGGWTGGDKGAKREINIGTTLAEHGYVGMSINYVLLQERWPVDLAAEPARLQDGRPLAARECRAAEHRPESHRRDRRLGRRASRVRWSRVTGDDKTLDPAGPYGKHSTKIRAVVDMYGPLPEARPTKLAFLGKSARRSAGALQASHADEHLDKNDPPFLILHGTADTTVPVTRLGAIRGDPEEGRRRRTSWSSSKAPRTRSTCNRSSAIYARWCWSFLIRI